MKKFLPLAALLLSAFTRPAAPVERLGIKGPLSFQNASYTLAWTDKPSEGLYIQEYLPAGETAARFTRMITVNVLAKDVAPEDAVRQKTAELEGRKKTDAVCHYAVSKSPDGKEYIVDFLLGQGEGAAAVVEFNLYRYKRIEVGGNRALLLYAFTKRGYGSATTNFLTELKKERPTLLNAMAAVPLPAIKFTGN